MRTGPVRTPVGTLTELMATPSVERSGLGVVLMLPLRLITGTSMVFEVAVEVFTRILMLSRFVLEICGWTSFLVSCRENPMVEYPVGTEELGPSGFRMIVWG